jgi:hypothetical protein
MGYIKVSGGIFNTWSKCIRLVVTVDDNQVHALYLVLGSQCCVAPSCSNSFFGSLSILSCLLWFIYFGLNYRTFFRITILFFVCCFSTANCSGVYFKIPICSQDSQYAASPCRRDWQQQLHIRLTVIHLQYLSINTNLIHRNSPLCYQSFSFCCCCLLPTFKITDVS